MKVERLPTPEVPELPSPRPPAEVSVGGGALALPQQAPELSHLVTTMRREAQMPAVRPAVIAQIRQEMAQGTFGGAADVERTLTALLGEFFL